MSKLRPTSLNTTRRRASINPAAFAPPNKESFEVLLQDVHDANEKLKSIIRETFAKGSDNLVSLFRKYDTDGSGDLDLAEWTGAMKELHISQKEPVLEALFGRYDADSSTRVSYPEFLKDIDEEKTKEVERITASLTQVLKTQKGAHALKKLFKKFDKDGSGTLDAVEFTHAVKDLLADKSLSIEEVETVFKRLDVDGSGSIELVEFFKNASTNSLVDKNKDHEILVRARDKQKQIHTRHIELEEKKMYFKDQKSTTIKRLEQLKTKCSDGKLPVADRMEILDQMVKMEEKLKRIEEAEQQWHIKVASHEELALDKDEERIIRGLKAFSTVKKQLESSTRFNSMKSVTGIPVSTSMPTGTHSLLSLEKLREKGLIDSPLTPTPLGVTFADTPGSPSAANRQSVVGFSPLSRRMSLAATTMLSAARMLRSPSVAVLGSQSALAAETKSGNSLYDALSHDFNLLHDKWKSILTDAAVSGGEQALRDLFKQFSPDESGRITLEKWKDELNELDVDIGINNVNTADVMECLFVRYDENKDNMVDYDEFVKDVTTTREQVAERIAKELTNIVKSRGTAGIKTLFNKYDSDGGSTLDLTEFGVLLQDLLGVVNNKWEVEHVFKKFDIDNSGECSLSEFLKMMSSSTTSQWKNEQHLLQKAKEKERQIVKIKTDRDAQQEKLKQQRLGIQKDIEELRTLNEGIEETGDKFAALARLQDLQTELEELDQSEREMCLEWLKETPIVLNREEERVLRGHKALVDANKKTQVAKEKEAAEKKKPEPVERKREPTLAEVKAKQAALRLVEQAQKKSQDEITEQVNKKRTELEETEKQIRIANAPNTNETNMEAADKAILISKRAALKHEIVELETTLEDQHEAYKAQIEEMKLDKDEERVLRGASALSRLRRKSCVDPNNTSFNANAASSGFGNAVTTNNSYSFGSYTFGASNQLSSHGSERSLVRSIATNSDFLESTTLDADSDIIEELQFAVEKLHEKLTEARLEGTVGQNDLKCIFEKYDSDGSGTLDLQEWKLAMKDLAIADNDIILEAIFRRYDKDNSGGVTYEEFIEEVEEDRVREVDKIEESMRQIVAEKRGLSSLKAVFKKYDTNGDQSLDIDEFTSAVKELLKLEDDDAALESDMKVVFSRIDVNGSGTIDFMEFMKGLNMSAVSQKKKDVEALAKAQKKQKIIEERKIEQTEEEAAIRDAKKTAMGELEVLKARAEDDSLGFTDKMMVMQQVHYATERLSTVEEEEKRVVLKWAALVPVKLDKDEERLLRGHKAMQSGRKNRDHDIMNRINLNRVKSEKEKPKDDRHYMIELKLRHQRLEQEQEAFQFEYNSLLTSSQTKASEIEHIRATIAACNSTTDEYAKFIEALGEKLNEYNNIINTMNICENNWKNRYNSLKLDSTEEKMLFSSSDFQNKEGIDKQPHRSSLSKIFKRAVIKVTSTDHYKNLLADEQAKNTDALEKCEAELKRISEEKDNYPEKKELREQWIAINKEHDQLAQLKETIENRISKFNANNENNESMRLASDSSVSLVGKRGSAPMLDEREAALVNALDAFRWAAGKNDKSSRKSVLIAARELKKHELKNTVSQAMHTMRNALPGLSVVRALRASLASTTTGNPVRSGTLDAFALCDTPRSDFMGMDSMMWANASADLRMMAKRQQPKVAAKTKIASYKHVASALSTRRTAEQRRKSTEKQGKGNTTNQKANTNTSNKAEIRCLRDLLCSTKDTRMADIKDRTLVPNETGGPIPVPPTTNQRQHKNKSRPNSFRHTPTSNRQTPVSNQTRSSTRMGNSAGFDISYAILKNDNDDNQNTSVKVNVYYECTNNNDYKTHLYNQCGVGGDMSSQSHHSSPPHRPHPPPQHQHRTHKKPVTHRNHNNHSVPASPSTVSSHGLPNDFFASSQLFCEAFRLPYDNAVAAGAASKGGQQCGSSASSPSKHDKDSNCSNNNSSTVTLVPVSNENATLFTTPPHDDAAHSMEGKGKQPLEEDDPDENSVGNSWAV